MALSMRMRQLGRKNKRVYRFVVADSRLPRDGKYVECVGHYDPHQEDGVVIHQDKVEYWLKKGAQPSEKLKVMLKKRCPELVSLLNRTKVKEAKEPLYGN